MAHWNHFLTSLRPRLKKDALETLYSLYLEKFCSMIFLKVWPQYAFMIIDPMEANPSLHNDQVCFELWRSSFAKIIIF